MTLGEAVRGAAARLAAEGIEEPLADARVLAQEAFALPAARLLADAREPAPGDGLDRLERLVKRRVAGEPVGRILGRREFWGLPFALGAETLEPRPDTETVVEAALGLVRPRGGTLSILDLGVGTGCLLLALLSELPEARGVGVDRSPAAAAAARRNAEALGLAGRAAFLAGDWADAIDGTFDLVVSNPPYIGSSEIPRLSREVRLFDPLLALDGGADGLDAYRAIVAALPRLLARDGVAALELGAGQAQDVAAIAADAGLAVLGLDADLSGTPRALTLGRRGEAFPEDCK